MALQVRALYLLRFKSQELIVAHCVVELDNFESVERLWLCKGWGQAHARRETLTLRGLLRSQWLLWNITPIKRPWRLKGVLAPVNASLSKALTASLTEIHTFTRGRQLLNHLGLLSELRIVKKLVQLGLSLDLTVHLLNWKEGVFQLTVFPRQVRLGQAKERIISVLRLLWLCLVLLNQIEDLGWQWHALLIIASALVLRQAKKTLHIDLSMSVRLVHRVFSHSLVTPIAD